MNSKKNIYRIVLLILFFIFIVVSYFYEISLGKKMAGEFIYLFLELFKIVPLVFLLIGFFEVWVDRKTIEKHFGEKSKHWYTGHLWGILMSVFNIGGMYLAFPVAYMLLKKGAKLSVVLTYLGAAAVMRINLFIYEIHFLGLKFTLIRLCTSLPLIVLSSCLLPIIFKFNVTVEEK